MGRRCVPHSKLFSRVMGLLVARVLVYVHFFVW